MPPRGGGDADPGDAHPSPGSPAAGGATSARRREAPGGSSRLRLKPVPPYDFELSVAIFSRGDPGFRSVEGGVFRQAVRLGDSNALLFVRSEGTVESPLLEAEVRTPYFLSRSQLEEARALVTRVLNLNMDLEPFYRQVRGDPLMSGLARRLHGLKSPSTPTVFEALVDSIIEQQISLAAALSMQSRLIRKYGEPVTAGGESCYLYPTPGRLASATPAGLRSCGLSARKSEYVRDAASMVSSGELDLDRFASYEDADRIRGELKAVRGVGDWTAEMTMLRGLGRMDSLPADDVGIQAKMTYYYGREKRVTADDLRRAAENWGSYRGLGAFYLIMAHHVGLGPAEPRPGRAPSTNDSGGFPGKES